MDICKILELRKAKYIKRWKGKDGKWKYKYKEKTGRMRKIIAFHTTSEENKKSIMKHGFDPNKGSAMFLGAGVYFSDKKQPMKGFGDAVIKVKIRLNKPLEDYKTWKIIANSINMKGLSLKEASKILTENIKEKGFDGIIAKKENGFPHNEIVVFDAKNIEVTK